MHTYTYAVALSLGSLNAGEKYPWAEKSLNQQWWDVLPQNFKDAEINRLPSHTTLELLFYSGCKIYRGVCSLLWQRLQVNPSLLAQRAQLSLLLPQLLAKQKSWNSAVSYWGKRRKKMIMSIYFGLCLFVCLFVCFVCLFALFVCSLSASSQGSQGRLMLARAYRVPKGQEGMQLLMLYV